MAPTPPAATPPIWTWLGFLAAAICAVGLIGLFATFAAPLPLQRAMAREAALDDALAASRGPDPTAALEALRPRLDDSAAALLPYAGDQASLAGKVARERPAMRARLEAEAAAIAKRLRLLIFMVTLMAIVFAAAVLRGLTRSRVQG